MFQRFPIAPRNNIGFDPRSPSERELCRIAGTPHSPERRIGTVDSAEGPHAQIDAIWATAVGGPTGGPIGFSEQMFGVGSEGLAGKVDPEKNSMAPVVVGQEPLKEECSPTGCALA